MDAWGFEPWDNDEAADWFGDFMERVDVAYIIKTVDKVSDSEEYYDEIRAVAYILQVLGKNYIWPIEHADALDDMLLKIIGLLENMIKPGSDFLNMWADSEGVITSVEKQIAALKSNQ